MSLDSSRRDVAFASSLATISLEVLGLRHSNSTSSGWTAWFAASANQLFDSGSLWKLYEEDDDFIFDFSPGRRERGPVQASARGSHFLVGATSDECPVFPELGLCRCSSGIPARRVADHASAHAGEEPSNCIVRDRDGRMESAICLSGIPEQERARRLASGPSDSKSRF